MAIKRVAYSCEFKCGQKVVLSEKSMIDHESRCFHNPEKKACITCKHFEREKDNNGLQYGNPHRQEWVNLLCNYSYTLSMYKMKNNCPFHEVKQ